MCFKKLLSTTPTGNQTGMLLPAPKNLVELKQQQIKDILKVIAPTCTILYSDSIYSTTSIDELRRFIKDDKTNEYRYISEYYDCDDFSFRLMGMIHCVEWGALPFGIMLVNKKDWITHKTTPHAMNCFIDDKKDFWIIEPQSDQIGHINSNYKPYFIMI